MGSWLKCRCGNLIHKNLFCGTGISLIATEEFLDVERENKSAEDLVNELVLGSSMLLKCKSCGRLVILRESPETDVVEYYIPEN